MSQQVKFSVAKVLDAGTVSNAIDASDSTLCAVHIPAGLEGVTLTLQASDRFDGTYRAVHSAGALYSLTVAANTVAVIPPDVTRGLKFIKLVVGAQTGDIELKCALVDAPSS